MMNNISFMSRRNPDANDYTAKLNIIITRTEHFQRASLQLKLLTNVASYAEEKIEF